MLLKRLVRLVVFVARPDLWKERQEKLVRHFLSFMPDKTERKAKLTYQYYEEWIPELYNIRFPFYSDFKKHLLIWKNRNKPFMKDVFSRDVPIICHKSVALAAQTFMLSIKAAGYDSCPMEGMDSERIKAYLHLPKKAEISMVIGVGKGLPEGMYGKRFRIPNEDVIFTL
jgi:nitroreductase